MKKQILTLLLSGVLLVSCTPKNKTTDETTQAITTTTTAEATTEVTTTEAVTQTTEATTSAPKTNDEIIAYATQILQLIKDKDYASLSTYVSDDYKLGFSPYSNADFNQMVYMTAADVASIPTTTTQFTWGVHDGSGEPIVLKPTDYFAQFVYDQDFISAPQVSVDSVIGKGNMIDNTSNAPIVEHFVEFHFPSFDPQYDGMDWESLRLAFKTDSQNNLKLVLIIHDQWTI